VEEKKPKGMFLDMAKDFSFPIGKRRPVQA
jgi:hypothetical protein